MGTQDDGFEEISSLEKHSSGKLSVQEKHGTVAVSTKVVDTAAELVSGEYPELDPAEARRVRSAVFLLRFAI